MPEPIFGLMVWGAIILGGVSIVSVLTFWMTLGSRITAAELRAKTADALATAAVAKAELMWAQFADYKVASAREMAGMRAAFDASVSAFAEADRRLAKAIDDFGERIDRMSERLDRILSVREHTR